MKLIVADSSPLIVFARSELLPILRQVVRRNHRASNRL